MRSIFFIIILVTTFKSVAQYDVQPQIYNPSESAFTPKTYAIIIGVTGYKKLNSTRDLKFADDDALLMMDYLKTWDNVELYLYTNENATNEDYLGAQISEILNQKVKGHDKLIIYFSGHGDISKKDNNGYLLLNNVDDPTKIEYRWSDAIRIADIKETILTSPIKTENVYLIFDACNSGYAKANTGASATIGKEDKIILMLSSEADEVSKEFDDLEHGVFTYFLVNGLKGLADKDANLKITENELIPFVMDSVRSRTKGEQNPVFDAPYQYVLASYKAEEVKNVISEMNSNLDLASIGTDKGGSSENELESTKCQALMDLMLKQSNNGVFFQDQVDNQEEALTIGLLENAYNSSGDIKSIVRSRKGNFIGIVEDGKAQVFTNLSFNYGASLNATDAISCITFSPNEKILATGSSNQKIQFWSGETGDLIFESIDLKSSITAVNYIEDELIAIGTANGFIFLLDAKGSIQSKYKLHKAAVTQISVSYNILCTLGEDGKLVSMNLDTKLKSTIAKSGVNAFEILDETKQLLILGGNYLSRLDLFSGVESDKIEFKNQLTQICVDPYERYAVVAHSGKAVEVIDLFNFQVNKTKIKTKSNVVGITYVDRDNRLIIAQENGEVDLCELKVNLGLSAFNLRQLLNSCENIDGLKYKIDGSLVHGLNRQVKPVMAELIREDGKETTLEEISEAKRFAEMALKMGSDHVLDQDKLEINVLLLEVYEILKIGDKTKYYGALKKVDRMMEIDPNGSYAFNVAADLYIALDNKLKAKEVLESAEENAPNWIAPKMKVGTILTQEAKYKEAEEKFKEIIELNPKEAQAHAELAQVYLLTGDKKSAEKSMNLAKDLDVSVVISDTLEKVFARVVTVEKVITNSEFSNPINKKKENLTPSNKLENIDLIDGLQVGDFYMGGTVFYIDGTGKHGLVAAYQSKYNALTWDVAMNEILKMELNGFKDWKMPSLEDLKKFSLSPVYAPVTLFWSSAEDHLVPNAAYWYDVKEHWADLSSKSNKRYVMPIRAF